MDVVGRDPDGAPTVSAVRDEPGGSPAVVAALIGQITQLAYRFGFASDLRPAQWTALRFFDRALDANRTVSAFAEHNRTSRSSASQTVNGLVNRGLLVRLAVPKDRRTHRLQLTDEARGLLARDPLKKLEEALGGLCPERRRELSLRLQELLAAMQQQIRQRPG